jgi:hypothetical protein
MIASLRFLKMTSGTTPSWRRPFTMRA